MAGRIIDITFAILPVASGLMLVTLGATGFAAAVSQASIAVSVVGATLSVPLVAVGLVWIFVLPRAILKEEHPDDRPELGESR